jgi:Right handed beta helix region/Pel9A-like, right handed beta helix region
MSGRYCGRYEPKVRDKEAGTMGKYAAVMLVLVAAACLCGSAPAADYYVATTGSDSGPGTLAQPWATLQHAVQSIAPGDTIYVRAGTYVGCRITNLNSGSGSPGAPKTLTAYPGEAVLINAPGPLNVQNSCIEVEGIDGVEITDWVVNGFEVTGATYAGIDTRVSRRVTVSNNYSHDNSSMGIFTAFAYYVTIEYNECSYNTGQHGIYASNSADYATIRGNLSHHNGRSGIQLNGDKRFKPGDGVMSFNTIEDNILWENCIGTGGGGALNFDGMSDSIVRNNLLYNNHLMGITLYAVDAAEGSSRNLVYNNTIVMAPDSYTVIHIPTSKKGSPNPTGNRIKNNIIYTPDSADMCIMVWGAGALAAGGSDYNVTTNLFSVNGGKAKISLTQWRSYGFDAHSFISTPAALFVDPANSNYHLRAGSPAANAGTPLAEVTDDLAGVLRPQGGAYDIGCFEDW